MGGSQLSGLEMGEKIAGFTTQAVIIFILGCIST